MYIHIYTSLKLFDGKVIPKAVKANTTSGWGGAREFMANFHIVDNFYV